MKKHLEPSTAIVPVPVALVSCGDFENSNITTIAWTGVINSIPPMVYVSIRPERYSYKIISETREFVLNIPDEKLVVQTDYCGTRSGRDEDKFTVSKLTREKSKEVLAPAILECPISLECKVKEIKKLGSHDMFIAEVISISADEELIDDKGKIQFREANLLTYLGSEYYVANKKVADRGVCLK